MKSVPKHTTPINALHADVRRLLTKYKCKYELHEVRAQFMGAIASPIDQVNPMQELKSLWNGELPPVKNIEAVNELMQVFAMGLWNQLSAHCDPDQPFLLTEFVDKYNHKEINRFAQVKHQEIDRFIAGFFQGQDMMRLPPEISTGLDDLEDLAAMFAGVVDIPSNPSDTELVMRELMHKLTQIAEIAQKEINSIITRTADDRRNGGSTQNTMH